MIYSTGDWTRKELISLFNFAPEKQFSEDPDVLYAGEMIDVDGGGIKYYVREAASGKDGKEESLSNISEITLEPYSIEGNLFEIRHLKGRKN